MSSIWSYKVARDFGFAPNPFGGVCTLACCKPDIRKGAKKGDWIVGVGAKQNKLWGRVIYAMIVDEILNFDEYWNDLRFQRKKPVLGGSHKRFYGDNIYRWNPEIWDYSQSGSHHSMEDGSPNTGNLKRDTARTNRVLLAREYVYFGRNAIRPPEEIFSGLGEIFPNDARNYYKGYSKPMEDKIRKWLTPYMGRGLQGLPKNWN